LNTTQSSDITDLKLKVFDIGIVNATQTTDIDALQLLTVTHSDEIADLKLVDASHSSEIADLKLVDASHSSEIELLDILTSPTASSLVNTNLTQSAHTGKINLLESTMLTEQPNINASNLLNSSYLGNGDVSNNKLSSLNDIRVDVSIQNQLNTLTTSPSVLDGLQDVDLVNIPVLQSNVALLRTDVDKNISTMLTKQPTINADNKLNSSLLNRDDNLQYFDLSQSLLGKLNTMTTATNINANSVSTNATSIQGLLNADVLHSSHVA
jgi:hypothetical protein